MFLNDLRDRNLAFSQSYQLFAQLFSSAPEPQVCEEILSLTEINCSTRPQSLFENSDEAAATHYHIFNMETLPYESVFLEESRLAGGSRTLFLQQAYQSFNFNALSQKVEADHISAHLGFLSHLSNALAKAATDAPSATMRHIESRTKHFLQNHFLSWLPAYIQCLNPENVKKQYRDAFVFFQEVTLFVFQLANAHEESLDGANASFVTNTKSPCILDSPECKISDIAAHFSTPSLCGVFLRRSDIQAIGRFLDLPSGFGSRLDMLSMVFTCAAEYGSFEKLLTELQNYLERAEEFHQAQTRSESWVTICRENLKRIEHLHSQVADLITSDSTKENSPTPSINV